VYAGGPSICVFAILRVEKVVDKAADEATNRECFKSYAGRGVWLSYAKRV
jgi:hypothetical protein